MRLNENERTIIRTKYERHTIHEALDRCTEVDKIRQIDRWRFVGWSGIFARAEIFRKSEIRKQRGKLADCEEDRLGPAREQ